VTARDTRALAESREESKRRSIRRVLRLGLWIWPSFALLDAYMCTALYPDAPFRLFLAYRLGVEGILLAVHWLSQRTDIPVRRIAAAQAASFVLAALCIALMGLHLGGARSAYIHGISIVVLVRTVSIPEPWRRSLVILAPIGLVYPAVLAGAALASPAARAEWFEFHTLGLFAANYVFVLASTVVGVVAGHAVWAARQQVYRARRLGRYRLQAPIGKGGMGEVWLAWDPTLRRNVALKLLRADGAADSETVARFETEAYATSRLRVPHTVQIYDFGASDDGIYFLAMEYLAGTDLNTLVTREGPLAAERAVRLARQACLSLEEAHAAGIIHRDVKPQNMIVTQVGDDREFLKLLDFGLARINTGAPRVDLTRVGSLIGTPAFLAPELWQGGVADARSDIYALGATLYFMVAGSTPFEGTTIDEYFRGHLELEPVPPSERRGTPLPGSLDRIILRCIDKDPSRRFRSARELEAALAEAFPMRAAAPFVRGQAEGDADLAGAARPSGPARMEPGLGALVDRAPACG